MFYYRVLTWQSEATWRLVDGCPCDTWTRVRGVCVCVMSVRDTRVCA